MGYDRKLFDAICKHADQGKGPPCNVPLEKVLQETGLTFDQLEAKMRALEKVRLARIFSEELLSLDLAGAILFFNSAADAQTILRSGKGRTNVPAKTICDELGWTPARMNAAKEVLKTIAPWKKRWLEYTSTDPVDPAVFWPT